MVTLSHLLEAPLLRPLLSYATRPAGDPEVERVALIEDFGDLARVPEHAIILLSRPSSSQTGSERFDVALRTAHDQATAAFVVAAADVRRLTPTSVATAERSGTAIVGSGADDLADLSIAIANELEGGAGAALLRAHAAVRTIAAHPPGGGVEMLFAGASAALGVALRAQRAAPLNGPRTAVTLDGRVNTWITAEPQLGELALAVDIVLDVLATRAREELIGQVRAQDLPIQSQEDALSELLGVPEHGRAPIVQRARDLGMFVDGWHVAARVELEDLAGVAVDDPDVRHALSRPVLAALRERGGAWHGARSGAALVLVRMYRSDPGGGASAAVAVAIDEALLKLQPQIPRLRLRCGVGAAHPGPTGLLESVDEAQAAVTAGRASGRIDRAIAFDSLGLRRSLVEWYTSATAQEAVASVLAPISAVGAAKAERLTATLHVYLDQQCSISRTADRLNLHRNAVAYRVNQIFSLLDVDRDNPDDLLLLQLACRARKLM
jgi:hypothetical protein